jgi:hypothetical protein
MTITKKSENESQTNALLKSFVIIFGLEIAQSKTLF